MAPLRLIAVLACASVLMAGCVGEDENQGEKNTSPRHGGTFRIGTPELTTLDPLFAQTVEEQIVADQLFDSLTTYEKEKLHVQPAIAKSWSPSPDLKQWDFVLDASRRFSNGRPITAEDVRYSLNRAAQKAVSAPLSDLLAPVVGYAAAHDEGVPELAGVTVVTPEVVHISLDRPVAELPRVLGNPTLAIVPREAVEKPVPAFNVEPVGSGPMRLARRSGASLTLSPVEVDTAYIESMVVRQFKTEFKAYQAFAAGDLDWVRVPAAQTGKAGDRFGNQHFQPYLGSLFYGLNLRSPKLADIRFRQAILHAVDRRKIVNEVYKDSVSAADQIVARALPGWPGKECGEPCRHDIEKAKSLLKEAFPQGTPPDLIIAFDDNPTQAAVARSMASDLKEVGIGTQLQAKPFGEYGQYVVTTSPDIVRLGWIPAYPSADAVFPQLFTSGSADNVTGFAEPEVDADLAAARAQPDPKKRDALFAEAQRKILATAVVIPIADVKLHVVTSERVRGLRMTLMGTFDSGKVWLTA